MNCQSPVNGNPCNQCPACLGIENGSILDVLELDAASNNGVDQVRALRMRRSIPRRRSVSGSISWTRSICSPPQPSMRC